MTRRPEWQKDGWAPAGPGQCRCPRCGTRVYTNAYARRAHERACAGRAGEKPVVGPAQAAAEKRREANLGRPPLPPMERGSLYTNLFLLPKKEG